MVFHYSRNEMNTLQALEMNTLQADELLCLW